jgi:hypothetical protein
VRSTWALNLSVEGVVLTNRLRNLPRAAHSSGESRERTNLESHGRNGCIVWSHDGFPFDDVARLAGAVRPRELARFTPPSWPGLGLCNLIGGRLGLYLHRRCVDHDCVTANREVASTGAGTRRRGAQTRGLKSTHSGYVRRDVW